MKPKNKTLRRPPLEAILFGDGTFNPNAMGRKKPIVVEQLEELQEASGGIVSGVHLMLRSEGADFEWQRDKVVPLLREVRGIKRVSGFTMAGKNVFDPAETAEATQWLRQSVVAAEAMGMTDLMWAGITPWLDGVDKPKIFRDVAIKLPLLALALAAGRKELKSRKGRPMNLMLEALSTHECPNFPVISTLAGPALAAEVLHARGGKIQLVPDTAHQGRAIKKGEVTMEEVVEMNRLAIAQGRVAVAHLSNPETRDKFAELPDTHPIAPQLKMYHELGFQGRFVVELIPFWPAFVGVIGLNASTVNYTEADYMKATAESMRAVDAKWEEYNQAAAN